MGKDSLHVELQVVLGEVPPGATVLFCVALLNFKRLGSYHCYVRKVFRNKIAVSCPELPVTLPDVWRVRCLTVGVLRARRFLQHVAVLMLMKEAEKSSDILRGKTSLEINFFILPSVSTQVLMFAG